MTEADFTAQENVMTEIVTIMPRRSLCHRVMPTLTAIAAVAAVLAGCNAFMPSTISHDQARAYVAEAGADTNSREIEYPAIETARKVDLVGIDCGQDGKLMLVRESEEYSLDFIMANCRDIQVR
jgi:hypothetical protein